MVLLVVLRGPLRRLDDGHALAGHFGSGVREALIQSYTGEVVATAERIERLGSFERVLRARAWSGSPITIVGRRGQWRSWTFADGERWTVRHAETPKIRRQRLIVAGADETSSDGLDVRAYVPGSHDVRLPIMDVYEADTTGADSSQVPFDLT
jgi:hypothetical protein